MDKDGEVVVEDDLNSCDISDSRCRGSNSRYPHARAHWRKIEEELVDVGD